MNLGFIAPSWPPSLLSHRRGKLGGQQAYLLHINEVSLGIYLLARNQWNGNLSTLCRIMYFVFQRESSLSWTLVIIRWPWRMHCTCLWMMSTQCLLHHRPLVDLSLDSFSGYSRVSNKMIIEKLKRKKKNPTTSRSKEEIFKTKTIALSYDFCWKFMWPPFSARFCLFLPN